MSLIGNLGLILIKFLLILILLLKIKLVWKLLLLLKFGFTVLFTGLLEILFRFFDKEPFSINIGFTNVLLFIAFFILLFLLFLIFISFTFLLFLSFLLDSNLWLKFCESVISNCFSELKDILFVWGSIIAFFDVLLKEKLISFLATDIHHPKHNYKDWKNAKAIAIKYISNEEYDRLTIINPSKIIC